MPCATARSSTTTLLYGTGMRLLECLRLRVKDVEFGNSRILVRDAKGHRDRVVPLPAVVRAALPTWLSRVRRAHLDDLSRGFGGSTSQRGNTQAPSGIEAGSMSFPASTSVSIPAVKSSAVTTCTKPQSSAPSVQPSSIWVFHGGSAATRSAIPPPHICSKRDTISVPSRSSWDIKT